MPDFFSLLTRFVEAMETLAKNSGGVSSSASAEIERRAQNKKDLAQTEEKPKAPPAEGKSKQADAPVELDYAKDVQPDCLKLIAKDKPAFVAILRKYDLTSASGDAARPHWAAILADVKAALEVSGG